MRTRKTRRVFHYLSALRVERTWRPVSGDVTVEQVETSGAVHPQAVAGAVTGDVANDDVADRAVAAVADHADAEHAFGRILRVLVVMLVEVTVQDSVDEVRVVDVPEPDEMSLVPREAVLLQRRAVQVEREAVGHLYKSGVRQPICAWQHHKPMHTCSRHFANHLRYRRDIRAAHLLEFPPSGLADLHRLLGGALVVDAVFREIRLRHHIRRL